MPRKNFRVLMDKMPADHRAAAIARAKQMIAEMPLQDLRRARDLTQATLATAMETTQSEVSKIESRTDCYVSTLRSYVHAMGGELEIVARFPEGSIRITQFADLQTK